MPVVDVSFSIQGTTIPVDHGYRLFSAISHMLPDLHADDQIGVHHVPGTLNGNRMQLITPASRLTIRLPSERIGEILSLAGKTLTIGEYKLRVGIPNTRALIPKARLYSRLVIIKGFVDPEAFLEAVKRQLAALAVQGKPYLVSQPEVEQKNLGKSLGTHSPFLRRTMRIRDKEIVGFAVGVEELTAEESILVQEQGLGGRRRFGCGIFTADRR